jgi:hypothetical protein
MSKAELESRLEEWVIQKEQNGIKQHDIKWHEAKLDTIGGSSMSTIQGTNPYENVGSLIKQKIGMTKFRSSIQPQWGNLFEDVIKRVVEHDRSCKILGEDLFVFGPPNTSYSPDGLAVMELETDNVKTYKTVLVEFKCPYSRIPNGSPPVYYIPQVKMGLDLLGIPDIGLFIEGVFRRCAWDDLANTPVYDKTLVPKSSGDKPIAYGIIGFYYDKTNINEENKEALFKNYSEYYSAGDSSNEYMSNDLGDSDVTLFKIIMDAYDKKMLSPWFGSIVFVNDKYNLDEANYTINVDLENFTRFCSENDHVNFGILPWKLFQLDYHYIQKEENYLNQWLPKIREIIDIVKKCNDPANERIRSNILNSYINRSSGRGFGDF